MSKKQNNKFDNLYFFLSIVILTRKMHDCTICFEPIENEKEIFKTPCGHVFHNSCVTPWFLSKNTCPMCRHNYGDEEYSDYEDEEDEEMPFMTEMDFVAGREIMNPIQNRIEMVYENPEEATKDWVVSYVNGDRVHSVYSLIKYDKSIFRFDFEYNTQTNCLSVSYISEQVFNENKKYQINDNWVFRRRANGYYNYNNTEF